MNAMPLEQLGFIEVRGADAETFLQGQLSNDVRELSPARGQLSSYNSPKGRMLAVLHLFRHDDAIYLELHRSVLEATLKRLRMFVLRSKVTLEDASQRWAALGLAAPEASAALQHAGLPLPQRAMDLAWKDGIAVLRRHGETPRYTVSGPRGQLPDLPAMDDAMWRLTQIEAGVPTVYPQTSDRFVPQMCNLDALGGISFNKGCYTGQEIVARVHYRGAVKRHMVQTRLPTPPPEPGTKLEQGEVVDAAPLADGGSIALLVAAGA